MTRLKVSGLSRSPWFSQLQFTLEAGEITVLRGPSGSGKTLLLRSLADLDPIDAGRLVLDGVDRSEFSPQDWRRQVRYVHQQAPHLAESVGSSLERAAGVLGLESGGVLGIPPGLKASQRTSDLSGGEAQRLALHIALHSGACVLLLDEPTSALDHEAARLAEEDVRKFADKGSTVLWITHEDGLAPRVGAKEMPFG